MKSKPTGFSDENLFVPRGFYYLLFVVTFFRNIDSVGSNLNFTNIIMITAAFTRVLMLIIVFPKLTTAIAGIKLSTANMAHGIYSLLIYRLFIRVCFLIYNVYVLILRVVVNGLVYGFMVGFT